MSENRFGFFFGVTLPRIISTIMNGGNSALPDCYINGKISKALILNMGWPKISLGFFRKLLWENSNKIFG